MQNLWTRQQVLKEPVFSGYPGIKFHAGEAKCTVFARPSDILVKVPLFIWTPKTGRYELSEGTLVPSQVVFEHNDRQQKVDVEDLCFLDPDYFRYPFFPAHPQFGPFLQSTFEEKKKTGPPKEKQRKRIAPKTGKKSAGSIGSVGSLGSWEYLLDLLENTQQSQFSPADQKAIQQILQYFPDILYLAVRSQPSEIVAYVFYRTDSESNENGQELRNI